MTFSFHSFFLSFLSYSVPLFLSIFLVSVSLFVKYKKSVGVSCFKIAKNECCRRRPKGMGCFVVRERSLVEEFVLLN